MVDRKRRNARPSLEPMEGRALLSGLLVALQAPVPQISPSQEVTIASNLSTSSKTGQVSAKATTNASGLYIGAEGPNAAAGLLPGLADLRQRHPDGRRTGPREVRGQVFRALSIGPGRFSDQKQIYFLRGLGGSTPNFFLHGDYSLAIVIPTDPTQPTRPGSRSSTTRTTTPAAWSASTSWPPPSMPRDGRPD